jgi:RHS repeat-associated protein
VTLSFFNASTNYFVFDGHDSTRVLADNAGNVANAFTFDAYGTLIASNASPQTAYLYTGQQFDSEQGSYYFRVRVYNPGTGRFPSADPPEGHKDDPLSLHRYTYCEGNPIDRMDPNGTDGTLVELAINVGIQAGLGALSGVAVNGVYNHAVGNPFFQGAGGAALFGAAALPLSVAFPFVGVGLAGVGIYSSGATAYHVFTSPDATASQKGAAAFLVGLSLFGGYAAADNAAGGSLWVNAKYFSSRGIGNGTMPSFQRGLAESRDYVAALMDAINGTPQKGFITMAVGIAEDSSGNRFTLIGTSEKNGYIRPVAKPIVAARGGIVVKGTGHAEADVVAYAKAQGWTLIAVGATRPICDPCAADIASAGATAATPLKNP